jgi:LPXTG-motif cell wall-anchored protein
VRRLLYLTVLSMLVVAMTASVALAQPQRGPSGADGSYNCADFDTQTQAQNYYEGQGGVSGGDPDGLDADQDGRACETLPPGNQGGGEQPTTPEPTTEQPQPQPEGGNGDVPRGTGGAEEGATGAVDTNQYDDDGDVGGLPHTGGPSLGASASLLGGVALLAGGLLLRRRLS